MATDKNDNGVTKDMFNSDEKQMLAAALEAYNEKVARKAAAKAPPQITKLWEDELKKISELARKVLA